MDSAVEATVDLNCFQDKNGVRKLLQSHGFKLTDLDRGQVFVEGSFQKLKDVKARLEQLVETTPSSSSRPPAVSSGAISKHYGRNNTDEGKPRRPDSSRRTFSGRKPDGGTPGEVTMVDSDVYRYASRFRRRELDALLAVPDVYADVKEGEESTIITLQGGSSGTVFRKLQRLLDDLSRSLRTQEVRLRDLSSRGKDLLLKIQENNNILGSVLVCEMHDRLHLVGPSAESYDLKQSLQVAPVGQSGARGRTDGPTSRGRSSSVNQRRREGEAADGASAGFPSPRRDGQEAAAGAAAGRSGPRGRSHSESRGKQLEEKLKGKENKDLLMSENPQKKSTMFPLARKTFSQWRKLTKKRK
ncbi:RNA-binding protein 43 [Fundulus diaphanus]